MIGLLGKKLGMTHVYDDYGRRRSVTAVQVGPCTVLGVRSKEKHGYQAVQLGYEPVKEAKLNKPQQGQAKKAGHATFKHAREFRLDDAGRPNGGGEATEFQVGQELTVSLFKDFELVDITGISIGKGFQGGMKRWHWSGGSETHGSMSHRAPGSIGSTTTPGRVWKGHHLPGHMGADRVTVQSVRIARIDAANHLVLVEGSVPGSENSLVMISKAKKRPGVVKKPQAFAAVIEDDENLSKTAKAASKKPKTQAAA